MSPKFITGLVIAGIAGLFALMTISGSFYTISETERGILLRNGAYVQTVGPGFNTKIPFVDTVIDVPLTQQIIHLEDMETYSKDQQVAKLKVSVIWQVNAGQVEDIYKHFKSHENAEAIAIKPRVTKAIKEVFGQYSAASSVSDRVKLGAEVEENFRRLLVGQPFDIVSVQIEDVNYGDFYDTNIQARMAEEVSVAKFRQTLEREKVEAQIKVVQANATAEATIASAKAEAQATLVQAQADAQGIELRGSAEAEAIQKRADAIAKNPAIVAFTQAQRWDGKLPVTMIPGGTLPFIDMNKVIAASP